MEYKKVQEFRQIINEKLISLVDNDYIYVDLPYYENLGDSLIWEGTLNFLRQLPYKCLYSTNLALYKKPVVDKNVVIILQGGGNWGDLWVAHHEFRKQVIMDFPENRIVVFPQSVHYQDKVNLEKDVKFFNLYSNVIICVRDQKSYDILHGKFRNKILLVPDMAFFVNVSSYRNKKANGNRILFAKRNDKELREDMDLSIIPPEVEIHDWPTLEVVPQYYNKLEKIHRFFIRLDRAFSLNTTNFVINWYWKHIIRPENVKIAIRFLDNYSVVYSTRLHVSILAVLLNKELYIIDNNYSKTKNYFDTWLKDSNCFRY